MLDQPHKLGNRVVPQEEEASKPMGNAKKFGLGMAGGLALGGANAGLGALASKRMANPIEGDNELFSKIRAKAAVPVEDVPGFEGNAAFMAPRKKNPIVDAHLEAMMGKDVPIGPNGTVAVGKNARSPSVLSHELGHADIHSSRLGRMVQNPLTIGLGTGAPALGSLTGLATGAFSDNQTVRHLGLAAPAIAALPQLAYEAGATIKGIKHMRNAGATRKHMMQFAKTLAPAWGTYATNAGMGVANAAVTQGIGGGLRGMAKDDVMDKAGGMLGELWEAANTPIPGTPKLLAGRNLGSLAHESTEVVKKAPAAVAKTKDQILAARRASYRPMPLAQKTAFSTNEYSGPMNPGKFRQESDVPPFRAPGLGKAMGRPSQKIGAALTPAGRMASSSQVGKGFGKAPSGPSIAEVAKPKGIGSVLPGAGKNMI